MKKFAVGYIDFFNNNLIIEIVNADDWKEALMKHSKLESGDWDIESFDETLDSAKNFAFNCDMMIDVVELNESN